MNNSCIIFSCTILSKDRLFVLSEFLDSFNLHFNSSDIFVGINYNSIPDVEDILVKSGLCIKYARSTKELYSDSDASAYQTAINLYKQHSKIYDYCWFVHTKGAVNSYSDYLRKWYIDNLIQYRTEIETFMDINPLIGSYGLLCTEYNKDTIYNQWDTELPLFSNVVTSEFKYTHHYFFYIHTLYVVRGNILTTFVSLLDSWYSTKLSRYYFEGIFPFIVSRLGYFPYTRNAITLNGVSVTELHAKWILENNLPNLLPYTLLPTTNFTFKQLNPPYYIQ